MPIANAGVNLYVR